MFDNKTIMITGGTGSFGNAVLKKFLNTNIKEIRVFSRDEKKQDDMRKFYNNNKINFYVGDVRDISSVKNAMNGVDYIFHAAALKQVPSCEFFPLEAVKTNILGANNVITAAIDEGVKKIVCLSTDKAAYPINAMGLSKAMMEKVYISKSKTIRNDKTIICGTRYGNVMASRGSVIPLFVEQIKKGQNLTITNGDMTRFLISLDDSVDLVLYALENGKAGDLYVQKSPACSISDLAQAIKTIFKVNNKIQEIGIRHGEKMYETLLTKEEMIKAIDCGKYYRIPCDKRNLNYSKYYIDNDKESYTTREYNSNNTTMLSVNEIIEKLLSIDYIKNELNNFKNL